MAIGDCSMAIEYNTQQPAITKEAYGLQGDFSKAIEHHVQDLAIAMEVGDWAGEG
jgi:hypothetical protein